MKYLEYRRHSKKTKDGKNISKEGLVYAAKHARRGIMFDDHPINRGQYSKEYTNLFAGSEVRTWQTLAAASNLNIPHESVPGIGNDELFNTWLEQGWKKHLGEIPHLEAMRRGMSKDDFFAAMTFAGEGVLDMFDILDDDGRGLAFGHSPVIELSLDFFKFDGINPAFQFAEMEGVVFSQNDDDIIEVKEIIRIIK